MNVDLSALTDGFSSKLKIISFFYAIIKIKKLKRILLIYEKKNKESPYLFTDHFLIKKFKIIKLKRKPKTKIQFNPYNYVSELKKLKLENSIKKNKDKKFNLISDQCYKNFTPSKKIAKRIKDINLPKNFISIHIRSTDRVITLNNFIKKIQFKEMIFDFQIKNMINQISNFIKNCTKLNNIFISSDHMYYKNIFFLNLKKNYNVYLNHSKFKPKKFRQTRGIDFITELFCLSKSKIIISTVGGAVTNAAYLMSGKKLKIFKWIDILNIFLIFKLIVIIIFFSKRIKSIFFKLFI